MSHEHFCWLAAPKKRQQKKGSYGLMKKRYGFSYIIQPIIKVT